MAKTARGRRAVKVDIEPKIKIFRIEDDILLSGVKHIASVPDQT